MQFEWDRKKALLNARKHGIQFADAVSVLDDDEALTTSEQEPNGEERMVTIGMDSLGRILVVVYTLRNKSVRIISARKATANERKQYSEIL